jgi:hypothetical protein
MLPFILGHSLSSKRILYVTWLSIATYLGWLGCSIYAYTNGVLKVNPAWMRLGTFWQGISEFHKRANILSHRPNDPIPATTAFAFTSASTLSLYASLKAGTHTVTTARTSTPRSFKTLSIISTTVAVLLVLPLAIFAALPNQPVTVSVSSTSR